MNKTVKKNVIATAIMTIILCVSLIAGSTFALFASESKVNIAASSGKVSVVASVDGTSVQTKQLNTDYALGFGNMYGGTATLHEEGLTLSTLLAGDGIKFNIVVENKSNVIVQYRTIISCENDSGLFAGLDVTIGDKVGYNGVTVVSNWSELVVGSENAIVPVSIELPELNGDEYQDKTCTITYKVEAIQGNSYTGPDANITRFEEADLPETEPVEDFFGLQFPQGPENVTVEAAWKFAAVDTAETVSESPYKDWICDFMIECDGNVELGELGLWGKYGGFDVSFVNPIALSSEQRLFMLTSTLTALSGNAVTYEMVCRDVVEFDCGVFRGLTGDLMKGKTITVSLCLIDTNYALQLLDELPELLGTDDQAVILEEAMKLKYWTIGENLLIANKTSYYFE